MILKLKNLYKTDTNSSLANMLLLCGKMKNIFCLLTWFLGVVDTTGENLCINYYIRGDKKGFYWSFPEESGAVDTSEDQIIYRNFTVPYNFANVIRCNIDKSTVIEIEKLFQIYLENLD